MCGMLHANLARGDCVVLTFFGFLHPKFVRAVKYYRLNVLFTSGFMIDSWMQRDDLDEDAFASVKFLSCGGSYLPPDKLKNYTDFARAHGYQGYIFRGYGMSELGGVEIAVPPDSDADILGFPHPVEDFRVQDDDGQFYTADQGERTGVLYATSKTMCLNVLDGEALFDLTEIDGRKFLCTNDMVRINADGSFSYAGRADRYFANNEGVHFEAGQVETELSRQPGIGRCVVVPVLDKRIHDSVPVLYVVPETQGEAGAETVRQALVNVFIGGGLAERSCLPSQFVLVNDIPCNSSGKVDVFRVTRERLGGRAYNIVPVYRDGVLADIATALTDHLDSITGGTLHEGMEGRSALGIYDLFNASSAGRNAGFPPGLF
jgi:acyl-coenzyme A synthetase/AMP-(fatty) acid ligase